MTGQIEWRWVDGWEGRYEVGSDGRVRSYAYGYAKDLSPTLASTGYRAVMLSKAGHRKERVYVHQLVARAFVEGRRDGACVRHLDGDPLNNRAENLAWGTQQDNIDDAVRHGTAMHRAKLGPDDVRVIREILAAKRRSGATRPFIREIADAFGVGASAIEFIRCGRTWSHVS